MSLIGYLKDDFEARLLECGGSGGGATVHGASCIAGQYTRYVIHFSLLVTVSRCIIGSILPS